MRAPDEKKRRTRAKPRRLSDAEIAEIDELLPRREWQRQEEGKRLALHDEEVNERRRLKGEPPLPDTSIDTSQYSSKLYKLDPGLHFILQRVAPSGSHSFNQAVDELFDSNIPLSQNVKALIKARYRVDPKQLAREQDGALALAITANVDHVAAMLKEEGFADATARAREYVAHQWRPIVKRDRGRSRFSSGAALDIWLRRALVGTTKNSSKMSCHEGRRKSGATK